MKYNIPHAVLTSFMEHSVNNHEVNNCHHVETLAYLVGKKSEDGNVTATDIIFPNQQGTSTRVEDLGEIFCILFWDCSLIVIIL